MDLTLAGADLFRFDGTVATPVNGIDFIARATGSPASIQAQGSDANVALDIRDRNANELMIFSAVSAAANEVTVANAAAGNNPQVAATGETNVSLELRSRGTGDVILADDAGNEILIADDVASAVNEITVRNAATGAAPSLRATGETNVSLNLVPNGTGTVQHNGVAVGALASVQVFTATGTWTRPAGITRVVTIVVGGGGGGAGAQSTAQEGGGGGGGGGTAIELVTSPAASETVTVGTGGAGGVGSSGGSVGGTSSFGAVSSATGGSGGQSINDAQGAGGDSGAGSGGSVNMEGGDGGSGIILPGDDNAVSGIGGSSTHGGGGKSTFSGSGGVAGNNFGGGGSGGADSNNTSRTGGAGADGIVIVWEYA